MYKKNIIGNFDDDDGGDDCNDDGDDDGDDDGNDRGGFMGRLIRKGSNV